MKDLNTSKKEYRTLNQDMRVMIFIRDPWLQLTTKVDMINFKLRNPFGNKSEIGSFHTVVSENYSLVFRLVLNKENMRKTNHWRVIFHFIWFYIIEEDSNTTHVRMDTEKKKIYYLTKVLSWIIFRKCSYMNQGW